MFRLSMVTVRFFLLLVAILQLSKSHTKARSSHQVEIVETKEDRNGVWRDGDYNPGQLRPVVEGANEEMEWQKTHEVLQ